MVLDIKTLAEKIILTGVIMSSFTGCLSKSNEQDFSKRVDEIANKVINRIVKQKTVWGNYCLDLSFEAMLEYGEVIKDESYKKYVLEIMRERNWPPEHVIRYEGQPFCHFNYKLYEVTNNEKYLKPFIQESERFFKSVPRAENGIALLRDGNQPTDNVIIDFIQDYASRMAQTGKLTGDDKYYKECVKQFRLYRKILRNPQTDLWSTGRGWLEDKTQNSPGAWSRGHGWLIRGVVDSLAALPKGSPEYIELQGYLKERSRQ